jgi:hypothetical protein
MNSWKLHIQQPQIQKAALHKGVKKRGYDKNLIHSEWNLGSFINVQSTCFVFHVNNDVKSAAISSSIWACIDEQNMKIWVKQ